MDESPNHPNPAFDNKYGVTLVATDESGASTERTVWVVVNDVDETSDPGTAQIGNQVWLDTNGDGIFQKGETSVSGVSVTLSGA
ncbi:MAG: SdrD B-like domain-containing protein, partial [Cyanobacteria bacterium P01_F01_bin.150]